MLVTVLPNNSKYYSNINQSFLCRLPSMATHRDHFVWHLSLCPCVCLSGSHTFFVVTQSYISQATHSFLGMLSLCFRNCCVANNTEHMIKDIVYNNISAYTFDHWLSLAGSLWTRQWRASSQSPWGISLWGWTSTSSTSTTVICS